MSLYGSQKGLHAIGQGTRSSLRGEHSTGTYMYRAEVSGGNGYVSSPEYPEGYNAHTLSKTSFSTGQASSTQVSRIHQKAFFLHGQFLDYVQKADLILQTSGDAAQADQLVSMSNDFLLQLKACAKELYRIGQPTDTVTGLIEQCQEAMPTMQYGTRRSIRRRKSVINREEPSQSFFEAKAWLEQQRRLIETSSWGDDPNAIEQQIFNHNKFHNSLLRANEMDRALGDTRGDKASQNELQQELENVKRLSSSRLVQLQELKAIIEEISQEIMWVNDREEEELMFDWGDKNIDVYIPKKQESYSTLMRDLEEKEKHLNRLNQKVDALLKNNHPASDKIEAYMDTLQTQWSWILQITKCIDAHLKENNAYSQFFKEANETYGKLQKDHENLRKNFTCNKNTPLENLLEFSKNLEREKERISESKRQVQLLVNKSKTIVRLKPRYPEEKSSGSIRVRALCDFKQDQKSILKDNEGILKENSQRSKWVVTGPGGLEMVIPSVCLVIPPPNPLSITLANKNEQYFEAIMTLWNQLYINVKSLISWQYCLRDISVINSLTISMLSQMNPEDYRSIIKSLETHYQEFQRNSRSSEMFGEEDKTKIETQYSGAQARYNTLVVQLPAYTECIQQEQDIQLTKVNIVAAERPPVSVEWPPVSAEWPPVSVERPVVSAERPVVSAERPVVSVERPPVSAERPAPRAENVLSKRHKVSEDRSKMSTDRHIITAEQSISSSKASVVMEASSLALLHEVHTLKQRLDLAESGLSQHLHVPFGEDSFRDCSQRIAQLDAVHRDINTIRDEYTRLREKIVIQLQGATDSDMAKFLQMELNLVDKKLSVLEGFSSAYLQRMKGLQELFRSMAQAEDIIKVHEARLTEQETTSLDPSQVEAFNAKLMQMKVDLDSKQDIMKKAERDLANVVHWNDQIDQSFHKCDVDISKYSERVGQMSDRWNRILTQINTRVLDQESYLPLVKCYLKNSSGLSNWIDGMQKQQESLQTAKYDDIKALLELQSQQKALNAEIKGKRSKVEEVQRDADSCSVSIKDYELQLATYGAGLETLLNIPIRKNLQYSPSTVVSQEASDLQSRYIELLTRSNDHYRFLGVMIKNFEELKLRNTRIGLLEEELRLLKDDIQNKNLKNQSLEDSLSRYQRDLSESKSQLLSLEEVKRTQAMQCNATKDDLDSTQNQMKQLNEQVIRLTYQIDEENRKRKLAEERYSNQQEEYELLIRKRQKELEEVNWAKIDIENTVKDKEREIERLKRQLEDETTRQREIESELSKVRAQNKQELSKLKGAYESEISVTKINIQKLATQKEQDTSELKLKYENIACEKNNLEEELRRLRLFMSEIDEKQKKAEAEVLEHKSAGTDESRRRRELELQVQSLMQQRTEDDLRFKESLADINKVVLDKNNEITQLSHGLEEELRKRKIFESENIGLKQSHIELQAQHATCINSINKLKASENEIRMKLENISGERHILQSRNRDLQQKVDVLEAEAEKHKAESLQEVTRRKRIEAELDRMTQSCKEYTNTIKLQKQQVDERTLIGNRADQELRRLQEDLDKSIRDNKAANEKLNQLMSEIKALQQQLQQEQARVKEANIRNETLYKTIEEKSKLLNDNTTEIEKLQSLTQKLTKEHLRVEEELRSLKTEKEDLKNKEGEKIESVTQITSLQLQLQTSSQATMELQGLVQDLTKERTKLKTEMEKIQKQAIETSSIIHDSQTHYNDLLSEKNSLLQKTKLLEQEKGRMQNNEDELNRIKISLESELRQKQRLQTENASVNKDCQYWKSQYELKDGQVRKYESEKDSLHRDMNTLKSEVARLTSELDVVDDKYKVRLQSAEKQIADLTSSRANLEEEHRKCKEHMEVCSKVNMEKVVTVDASKLLFDGVRKKVTAQDLCDCGVINSDTLNQLLKGQKTIPEVAVDIQVYLKGTGVIAGVVDCTQGKLTFTEAKNKNLIAPESAAMLLEAQAATGYIIDPRTNEKMPLNVACSKGLVNAPDRDRLSKAESASIGFKDPLSSKLLSVGQASRKGLINKETALRLLEAQVSVGGILDPELSIFLPKNVALNRNLIDDDLCTSLNNKPTSYLDPTAQQKVSYIDLKMTCKSDPSTGLLLLPAPEKPLTVMGLRGEVSINELVDAHLLGNSDVDGLREGKITSQDIEKRLRSYLQGSSCIAGIYDEANNRILPVYQAMKEGLLRPGTSLELLEAQAASGFVIDPVNNLYLTVEEACKKGLVGIEFKDKLVSAERAVTGYKDPTGATISLFQAIERGLIQKGHGIRLLEAQIASGGIIDPKHSHRIDVDVAYKRGYFDKGMNDILSRGGDDTKGFFDPNTEENLTYLQLKQRCITDEKTGLILLSLKDKSKQQKSTKKNTLRKRRVVIVDPDTNKEMSVREAYEKQLIDYETFVELSGQECEWEEITITAPDGSTHLVVIDRRTGQQFDIHESLNKGIIDQDTFDKYQSGDFTLTEFADLLTKETLSASNTPQYSSTVASSSYAISPQSALQSSSAATHAVQSQTAQSLSSASTNSIPSHPELSSLTAAAYSIPSQSTISSSSSTFKHISSVSFTVSKSSEIIGEQNPIGAIFDSETLEKVTITEAQRRGLVDSITAQRLLEAQACTGGIINPVNGQRLSIQEASRQGLIDEDMAVRLKPAQKAYIGFEDMKTRRKMSVAEAIKEKWVPYEAGQRFLEYQYLTGGVIDPEINQRRSIEDVIRKGWLDEKTARRLQDVQTHNKILTCPKTKLKVSYSEALNNSMQEENGVRMLHASSMSSKGISSPYNVSSAPGSTSGSRSGSRTGSRRGSVDLTSRYSYTFSSFSSSSIC